MKSSTLHLRILIALLVITGVLITAYQIFVLKTPLKENKLEDLWTIDARIQFEVRGTRPVEIEFYIPLESGAYTIANELFVANSYGQMISDNGTNRLVRWTARRVAGTQNIFYRLNLMKNWEPVKGEPGESWRAPIAVEGAEQIAVDTLIEEIRQKSSNISSFITTTITTVNDISNSNVRLLMGPNDTLENRIKVIELLLSQGHIPMQVVHTLRLVETSSQTPETWIRSYFESTRRTATGTIVEENWFYYNLETGSVGLPEDRLIWWVGKDPMIKTVNAERTRVNFSIDRNELTALSLAKIAGTGNTFSILSFYSLPLSTQMAYRLMLMIPFGVLVILVLRNIVGIETLGTFTPVLIAIAFRETGLIYGILFFFVIVFIGLSLRSYLENLKLQMLPRLAVVLTFVIICIVIGSMICYKLGFDQGLSVTLFPMVILTMTIERLSITWEERGGVYAFKVALGTLFTASIVFLVLNISSLTYFIFTFPAVYLLVIAFMLAMGRYRGYRLSELFRFKALLSKG